VVLLEGIRKCMRLNDEIAKNILYITEILILSVQKWDVIINVYCNELIAKY